MDLPHSAVRVCVMMDIIVFQRGSPMHTVPRGAGSGSKATSFTIRGCGRDCSGMVANAIARFLRILFNL